MNDLLSKLDPVVAVLVLGNAAQWWAYRKDGQASTAAISALTTAVSKLVDRVGGSRP